MTQMLDVERRVQCPDPENDGDMMHVSDCAACDYYRGVDNTGESLECAYGDDE